MKKTEQIIGRNDGLICLGTKWKRKRGLIYWGETLYKERNGDVYWLYGKRSVIVSKDKAMEWLRGLLVKED